MARFFVLKKFKKQDIVFAIFLVIAIIFLFVAPFIILPKVYGSQNIWDKDLPEETVFLELWEVDTFEGGSANRARFLEKTAYKFQELNNVVYIYVRTLTVEQATAMLAEGQRPDMVSFGIGAGELFASYCQPLDIKTPVRSELLDAGSYDGSQLAVPWCMGGYLLATTDEDINLTDLSVSAPSGEDMWLVGTGGEYNVASLALDGVTSYINPSERFTQYEAYEAFLKGNKFDVLLGTQRDYFRLQNRVNLGTISNIKYEFLVGYTDLVQYMAITTQDETINNCAKNFIRYLCSVTVQKTLTSIGMFGVTSVKIYQDSYSEFENVMMQNLDVLNVFTDNTTLNELRLKGKNYAQK